MGRTLTPYSQEYAAFQQRAQKFRRALRREDQLVLDEMLELGRLHLQAGVYAAAPLPLESFLLGLLLEQRKQFCYLETQLQELRKQLQLPEALAPKPFLLSAQQDCFHFVLAESDDDGNSGN